jgi:acetyl-CoA C-acetyltransferase
MTTKWLIDGVRSPFGRFGGGLRDVPLVDLGVQVLKGLLDRQPSVAAGVDELVVGIAMLEGGLMVPARQIAVTGGLRQDLPTLTVDRACCSGMTALGMGLRGLGAGNSLALALGIDVMSRTPRLLHETRWGSRRGDLVVEDLLLLRSPLSGTPIATYAGIEALDRGVTREMQDQWALGSHQRYFSALERGFFDGEMMAVATPDGGLARDEQPRADVTLDKLASLPCVYDSPTVTAGNAPGLNDGACALLIGDDEAVERSGRAPLARIHSYLQTAAGPTSAVWLPGPAICDLAGRAGLGVVDLDVIEINEAFAATALTSVRTAAGGDSGLEEELLARTNSHGGSVAIGHPTGASGARITLTAARRLRESGGRWAAAAVCGGFGQTDAVLLEAVS